jgi:hypothetical protein
MNDILSIIYQGLTIQSFCIKKSVNFRRYEKNKIFKKLIKFGDVKRAAKITGIDAEKMMLLSIKHNKYEFVKQLKNVSNNDTSFLEIAISSHRKRISRLLYGTISIIYEKLKLLALCAENGNFYIFKRVLALPNPNLPRMSGWILLRAVKGNNIKIINHLLNYTNLAIDYGSRIMRTAGKIGNIKVLELLMKYEQCKNFIHVALRKAILCRHYTVVKKYIKFSRDFMIYDGLGSGNLAILKIITDTRENIDDSFVSEWNITSPVILEYMLGNPKLDNFVDKEKALELATKTGNQKILDLLKK